jgi:hypothetical protein
MHLSRFLVTILFCVVVSVLGAQTTDMTTGSMGTDKAPVSLPLVANSEASGVVKASPAAQTVPEADDTVPVSFIGLSLNELIARYGAPLLVRAERGEETWQDDVVFTYKMGDLYVYRDHVWAVSVKSAYRVSMGDTKASALLALGGAAKDMGNGISCPLMGMDWPLMLRCDVDKNGKISSIFIYRSDL